MPKLRKVGRPPRQKILSQDTASIHMSLLLNFDYREFKVGDLVQWHYSGPWSEPKIARVIEVLLLGETPKSKTFVNRATRRRGRKYVARFDVSYVIEIPRMNGRRAQHWPDPRRLLPCDHLQLTDDQLQDIQQLNEVPRPTEKLLTTLEKPRLKRLTTESVK